MAATRSSNAWGYRPHLDGLRAVAVYLVVAFHAGVARASGGFIGVDVFFVLSGYLVTGVLVRDLEGPDGRIGLARFYARRARRLLPAAAVTLVVTAIVFGSIGGRVEVLDARNAIRAASLYVANWHFIAKSADYFAADLDRGGARRRGDTRPRAPRLGAGGVARQGLRRAVGRVSRTA